MTSPKVTNELKDVLKQITQELNNEKMKLKNMIFKNMIFKRNLSRK